MGVVIQRFHIEYILIMLETFAIKSRTPLQNKPVLLNPSKKQTLLALPPHKGVKEKLSLFDRIKQLLNVFGLFLSKNN